MDILFVNRSKLGIFILGQCCYRENHFLLLLSETDFLEAPRESGASLASAVLLLVVVVVVVVLVVVLVVLQVQPFLNNFGTTEPILKIQTALESFHQLIMLLTKY